MSFGVQEWQMFHGWGLSLSDRVKPCLFRLQLAILRFAMRSLNLDTGLFGEDVTRGNPIRQSLPSYLFSVAGISSGAIILTYGGALFFPVTVILILGLAGMGLSLSAPDFIPGFGKDEPEVEDSRTFPRTVIAGLTALASFSVLYWVLQPIGFSTEGVSYTAFFSTFQLPFTSQPEQVATIAFLVFTVPWGEENFFRALFGNLFLRYLPPGVAELAGGTVFMTLHAAVYSLFLGPVWGLIGLLTGAGTAFIAIDEYSGDIFSSELGHSLYNSGSFAAHGSILGAILGPAPSLGVPGQMAVGAVVPVLLVVRALRKRGKGLPKSSLRAGALGRLRCILPSGSPLLSWRYGGGKGALEADRGRTAYADVYGEGRGR